MIWTKSKCPVGPEDEELQQTFEKFQKEDFDLLNTSLVKLLGAVAQVRSGRQGLDHYLDKCMAEALQAAALCQREF